LMLEMTMMEGRRSRKKEIKSKKRIFRVVIAGRKKKRRFNGT
jgi:hypothetical protein